MRRLLIAAGLAAVLAVPARADEASAKKEPVKEVPAAAKESKGEPAKESKTKEAKKPDRGLVGKFDEGVKSAGKRVREEVKKNKLIKNATQGL